MKQKPRADDNREMKQKDLGSQHMDGILYQTWTSHPTLLYNEKEINFYIV